MVLRLQCWSAEHNPALTKSGRSALIRWSAVVLCWNRSSLPPGTSHDLRLCQAKLPTQQNQETTMKAHQGDHIILAASHVDEPTRAGVVLEVRGKDGGPPFLVRWADGHTGLMYPGPGSVLRVLAEHEHEHEHEHEQEQVTGAPAGIPQASADRPTAGMVEPTLGHVREWQVRVAIFESVFQAPSGSAVGRGKWCRARPSACRFLLDAVRS